METRPIAYKMFHKMCAATADDCHYDGRRCGFPLQWDIRLRPLRLILIALSCAVDFDRNKVYLALEPGVRKRKHELSSYGAEILFVPCRTSAWLQGASRDQHFDKMGGFTGLLILLIKLDAGRVT